MRKKRLYIGEEFNYQSIDFDLQLFSYSDDEEDADSDDDWEEDADADGDWDEEDADADGDYDYENYSDYGTVTGTSYYDAIYNSGNYVRINAGGGDDEIVNYNGDYTTIDGGAGNDEIYNYDLDRGSVNGGAGNDYIYALAFGYYNSTIRGGTGNDTIKLGDYGFNNVIQYANGDGNDVITGLKSSDTISISGGSYSTAKSGSDVIVSIGSGSIRLKNASETTLHIIGASLSGGVYIENSTSHSLVNGTNGNDTIYNYGDTDADADEYWDDEEDADADVDYYADSGEYSTINAGAGNDYVYNDYAYNVSINGGDGNDSIYNVYSDYVTVNAGAGNDFVETSGDDVSVFGGEGNDFIANDSSDWYNTLLGGKGNDSIYNYGYRSYVDGGADSDYIYNNYYYATLNGGDGADTIYSYYTGTSYGNSINGGTGNDSIYAYGYHNTIRGGTGNDTVSLAEGSYRKYMYASGDGNDLISGFGSTDTLQIMESSTMYKTLKSGSDMIVSIGSGAITLKSVSSANIVGGTLLPNAVTLSNSNSNTLISGSSGKDSIVNTGSNVTINTDADNDIIKNNGANAKIDVGAGNDVVSLGSGGSRSTVSGGAGNDSLNNKSANSKLLGGVGKDTLRNSAGNVTLDGGAGVDRIINTGANAYITGGAGNDSVTISGTKVTISGDADNDNISLGASATNVLIKYASGDGNDIIRGFNDDDSISISGSIKSTQKSGNDYVINVGSNKITLVGAANDYELNIKGKVITVSEPLPDPIINDDDNVKVTGTADDDWIINSGENVTIQPGKGNDTIEGDEDYGEQFWFAYNSGNNVITNFGKNDTLRSTNGNLTYKVDGDDVIVSITKSKTTSKITLQGTAEYNFTTIGSYLIPDPIVTVANDKSDTHVDGTDYRNLIINNGANVTITGGSKNDTIDTCDDAEMIVFGADGGQDYVTNFGKNDTLYTSFGKIQSTLATADDIIVNVKSGSKTGSITLGGAASLRSVLSQSGNNVIPDPINVIHNKTKKKKVTGTAKRDYITNSAANVSIQSGAGNDTIEGSNYGEWYLFANTDGNNVIANFGKNDTLKATKGTLTYEKSGNDVIVSITKSKTTSTVTLKDTGNYVFKQNGNVLTVEDITVIPRSDNKIKITGTSGRDSITSSGEKVTIQPMGGNDTLEGSDEFGDLYLFAYTYGDNVVTNFGKGDTLKSTSGTLTTVASGNDVIVNITKSKTTSTITLQGAGDGNCVLEKNGNVLTALDINVITRNSNKIKITGTSGRDLITSTGSKVTIQGNAGNDTIEGSDEFGDMFLFAYNHGNNIITNFGANDTLKATTGTPSFKTIGDDVVVSIKSGKTTGTVTLAGAADLNIVKSGNFITVQSLPDPLTNDDDDIKFAGTSDDDYMINNGERVTIQGKGGNDTIESFDGNQLYRFGVTDGNDVIIGFGKTDTLKITSGSITNYYASGSDYVIEVERASYSGSVTLQNVSKVKVSGSTVRATKFNSAADLPTSADDYWFEQDSAISNDELGEIISTDTPIDLNFDQLSEEWKPKLEIASSARHKKN